LDTQELSGIIAEVLKRINATDKSFAVKRKVLVILTDCRNELSILEEIKEYIDGYQVSLLTDGKNASLGAHEGFEGTFTVDGLASDFNEWIGQFEKVLIPSPSLKLVSNIAHVILNDRFAEVIFSALQEGKQVMIGQMPEDYKLQNLTAALKSEIQKLAAKLKGFGIEQMVPKRREVSNAPVIKDVPSGTKKVLSLQDVMSLTRGSDEISISGETVITPLAMDYIRDKKVSLKRK
jgi:ethanolamine utilization protein